MTSDRVDPMAAWAAHISEVTTGLFRGSPNFAQAFKDVNCVVGSPPPSLMAAFHDIAVTSRRNGEMAARAMLRTR